MKTEFQKSVVRLSFLCRLMDIKNAWKNPCRCVGLDFRTEKSHSLTMVNGNSVDTTHFYLHLEFH